MPFILAINGGSSSLRFGLFAAPRLERVLAGKFERIGLPGARLAVADSAANKKEDRPIEAPDHRACLPILIDLLQEKLGGAVLSGIGHRVVHGGTRYCEPQLVDSAMLEELRRISPFDPEHLPSEIAVIEGLTAKYRGLPQIACFDTAFHQDLPRVARLLPIPRRYEAQGVRRYGFHGLSYAYLMQEVERTVGANAAEGRIILAHLGNGASMAAVRNRRCIDTTMGFTPTAGLVMSTRSGDLDPGLVAYLARTEGMTTEQFHRMVNAESGLLGVSETSSDVRDLLQRETSDPRAAEALALFCYEAKKRIGALAAALGGVDTLVFAAGIGENSAVIRGRISEGLEFLGIELDPTRNAAHAPIISSDATTASVRVIRTDEELYIAREVLQILGPSPPLN